MKQREVISQSLFNILVGCSKVLSNIVSIIRYHQVSPGIMRAQKSILMIRFLTLISQYFTVSVSDHQYHVSDQIRSDQIRSDQIRSDQIRSGQIRSGQVRSDQIRSESICLKFG